MTARQIAAELADAPLWLLAVTVVTAAACLIAAAGTVVLVCRTPAVGAVAASPVALAFIVRAVARRMARSAVAS